MKEISEELRKRMKEKLVLVYGRTKGAAATNMLQARLSKVTKRDEASVSSGRFSHKDIVLITYGDMILDNMPPLKILQDFCRKHLKDVINMVHILPFFKYDSDRGFSIIDYRRVDSRLGDWSHIRSLAKDFRLMFDLVINHVSDRHPWFEEFKRDNPEYHDYFIWFTRDDLPQNDVLKRVFRPRAAPLLTEYETIVGRRYVWTTFPLNQVDLNFQKEEVLLDMIDNLLFYTEMGADIIRLDAIAYIWKELGTTCLNLKQVHVMVRLLRDVLDAVAPGVSLITETNVPHRDNIKYFGDGRNEAQMVYNFALPPLVLHTIYNEDASRLSRWVRSLHAPSDTTTFFNFLDSHDGIGILGARGILTNAEIEGVVKRAQANGALISCRKMPDGTKSPYEINTTWWSALNSDDQHSSREELDIQVRKYLVSRSIALCLKGVPGIYLNGLVGALNDRATVEKTGNYRDINRKDFDREELEHAIRDMSTRIHKVFYGYMRLIKARISEEAFHPNAMQKALSLNKSVFALIRKPRNKAYTVTTMHNLSKERRRVRLQHERYHDIVSGRPRIGDSVELEPYEVLWLKKS